MTMRTRTDFTCECGHKGHMTVSENDQPYSKSWERTDIVGFTELDGDGPRRARLRCDKCGQVGRVS